MYWKCWRACPSDERPHANTLQVRHAWDREGRGRWGVRRGGGGEGEVGESEGVRGGVG